MNCNKCRPLLPEYHESDLDAKLSAKVKKHLGECAKCRRELAAYEEINALANGLPRYEPGTATVLKIKLALNEQSTHQRQTQFGPVLTADELAEFLRIDVDALEQYIEEIPSFELGGKILFLRKSIETWIEGREKGLGFQVQESRLNQIMHLPVLEGGRRWKI